MNINTEQNVIVEKKANSFVLFSALFINVMLLITAIFFAGSTVSKAAEVPLVTAMWEMTIGGGMFYHGLLICLLISIFILYSVNNAIGRKFLIVEKIVSILLKLPINFLLFCFALFFGALGYGKFEVGLETTNLDITGGGYMLDWIIGCAILFLVFFVKKI